MSVSNGNSEEARNLTLLAAMMAEDPNPTERRKAIAAAKAQIVRFA